MARYRDKSSVGNTCPMIDDVISFINGLEPDDESDRKKVLDTLERIRSANSELRDWGNEMCQDKEHFESERDELQNQINRLEDDISNLQDEVKELKNEIEHLQEK